MFMCVLAIVFSVISSPNDAVVNDIHVFIKLLIM